MTNSNTDKKEDNLSDIEHVTVVAFPYFLNNNKLDAFKNSINDIAKSEDSIISDKYVNYMKNHLINGKIDPNLKAEIIELAKKGQWKESLTRSRGISDELEKSSLLEALSTELAKQGQMDEAATVKQEALTCKNQGGFLSYYKLKEDVFNAIYNKEKETLKLKQDEKIYNIELKDNCFVLINEYKDSNRDPAINYVYIVLSFKINPLYAVNKNSDINADKLSVINNYINDFKPKFFRELEPQEDSHQIYIYKNKKNKFEFKSIHTDSFILKKGEIELQVNNLDELPLTIEEQYHFYKIEIYFNKIEKNKTDIVLSQKPKINKSDKTTAAEDKDFKIIGKWNFDIQSKTSTEIAISAIKLDEIIDRIINFKNKDLNNSNSKTIIVYRSKDESELENNNIVLISDYKKPVLLHLFKYNDETININETLVSKFKEPLFGTLRLKDNYELENSLDNDYFYKTNIGACMVTLNEGAAIFEINIHLNDLFKKYFPAFIFALNQREVMLRINKINASINPHELIKNENYSPIEDLSEYINLFNFKQVFYVVSQTHELQLFYSKIQKAFSIDILLNDIKESVNDVQFLLDRKDRKNEEKHDKDLNKILFFLTIAQILPVILDYADNQYIPESIVSLLKIFYVACFIMVLIMYFFKHKNKQRKN